MKSSVSLFMAASKQQANRQFSFCRSRTDGPDGCLLSAEQEQASKLHHCVSVSIHGFICVGVYVCLCIKFEYAF